MKAPDRSRRTVSGRSVTKVVRSPNRTSQRRIEERERSAVQEPMVPWLIGYAQIRPTLSRVEQERGDALVAAWDQLGELSRWLSPALANEIARIGASASPTRPLAPLSTITVDASRLVAAVRMRATLAADDCAVADHVLRTADRVVPWAWEVIELLVRTYGALKCAEATHACA